MTDFDHFPPAEPPSDKAKYRQFLIDHELDPNLNAEDLARDFASKTAAEQKQLRRNWKSFVSSL